MYYRQAVIVIVSYYLGDIIHVWYTWIGIVALCLVFAGG